MNQKGKPLVRQLPLVTLVRARSLRRNQTDAERKLWRLLHSRRFAAAKFRRNHPIDNFFADFCCIKARLIIEVDGGQRADGAQAAYDRRRTTYLRSRGFKVMRFWNGEILGEPERVLEQIYGALAEKEQEAEPSPWPSPATKRARGLPCCSHAHSLRAAPVKDPSQRRSPRLL
jgi:very-short-patch-repair endonuclease